MRLSNEFYSTQEAVIHPLWIKSRQGQACKISLSDNGTSDEGRARQAAEPKA
jgi:hypothetical protein